jgi:hypothetical protein
MFCFSFFFSQSSVHPGQDWQSPSRRIRTYQTKNTKTQNGKKNSINQNNNNPVAGNETRKKKKPIRRPLNQNNKNPVAHSITRRKSSNQSNKNSKSDSKSGRRA